MIYIGNDIVEVNRIKESIQSHRKKFIEKIFTKEEIEFCEKRAVPEIHYAGRFAAKEAVKKAVLAIYSNTVIPLKNIQISRQENRPPIVNIAGNSKISELQIQLSISHTDKYASAVALVSPK